eukprot:PRCOL_00002798-RA
MAPPGRRAPTAGGAGATGGTGRTAAGVRKGGGVGVAERRARGAPRTASVSLAQLGMLGATRAKRREPGAGRAHAASTGGAAVASERMFVVVRVRPLLARERHAGEVPCWFVSGAHRVEASLAAQAAAPLPARAGAALAARRESLLASSYDFDRAFGPDADSEAVYAQTARGLVKSALEGVNATVFAYGATCSGKTFTMRAVTALGVRDAFEGIAARRGRVFLLRLSVMQIHKEVVQDLLAEQAPAGSAEATGAAGKAGLRLRDDADRGVVVDGLNEVAVGSAAECEALLAEADARRALAKTSANDASSRSHLIVRLTVESTEKMRNGDQGDGAAERSDRVLSSTITFVDLAGSERAEVSDLAAGGARRREGSLINRSLLTLSTVIRRLAEGGAAARHIPFRDSKLTRLLQTSLAGNGRAAVICALSPTVGAAEASRETLRFAAHATRVRVAPAINSLARDRALMGRYRSEIDRLRSQLSDGSNASRGGTERITGTLSARGGIGEDAKSAAVASCIEGDSSGYTCDNRPPAGQHADTEGEADGELVRRLAAERDAAQAQLRNLTRFLLEAPTPYRTPAAAGGGKGRLSLSPSMTGGGGGAMRSGMDGARRSSVKRSAARSGRKSWAPSNDESTSAIARKLACALGECAAVMTPKQQWNDMKSSLSHLDGKYGRGTATASAARQTGTDASVSVHASVDTATAASALARERASLRTKEAEMGEARAVAAAADLDGEVACLQVMNSGAGVGAHTPSVAARVAKLEADAGICLEAAGGGAGSADVAGSGPSGAKAGAAGISRLRDELRRTEHALARTASLEADGGPAPSSTAQALLTAPPVTAAPTAAASGVLSPATATVQRDVAALRAEVGALRAELTRREAAARTEESAKNAIRDLDDCLMDLKANVGRYCGDEDGPEASAATAGGAHGDAVSPSEVSTDEVDVSTAVASMGTTSSAGNESDEGVPTGATDGREPAHGMAVEIAAGQRAAVTFAIEGDEVTAAAAPRAAHAVKTSSAGETRALLDDERYCSKGACAAESPTAEGAAALSPRGAGSRAEMNATSSERDAESADDLKRAGDSDVQPASGPPALTATPLPHAGAVTPLRVRTNLGVRIGDDSIPLSMLGKGGRTSYNAGTTVDTDAASRRRRKLGGKILSARDEGAGVCDSDSDMETETHSPRANGVGSTGDGGVHANLYCSPAVEDTPSKVSKEEALEALKPFLKDRVVLAASKITEIKRHMENMQARYEGLDYQKSLAVERMLASELKYKQVIAEMEAPLDELVVLWAELREPLVRRARLYDAFALSTANHSDVRLSRRSELNRLRYLRQLRLAGGIAAAAHVRRATAAFEGERELLRRRVGVLPQAERAALYERFEIGERGRQRKRRLVSSTWLDSSAARGMDKTTGREVFRIDWRHIEVSTLTVLHIAGIALGADASDILLCPTDTGAAAGAALIQTPGRTPGTANVRAGALTPAANAAGAPSSAATRTPGHGVCTPLPMRAL